MPSFNTMLTHTVRQVDCPPRDMDIDIEITYSRSEDGVDIVIEEVMLEDGSGPLSEYDYDRFEDKIIELAEEHASTEDGESQYWGNRVDAAYDKYKDERMGL